MTDTTKLRMTLPDAQRGGVLLTTAAQWAKSMLMAGHRLTLAIHPETRKEAQSRKFHAICGDIAKSGHALHGKARTADEWKVLLISGHATATKEPTEFVPGLEGELVNIRESTAAMGVRRMASLLEYSIAYCALHRIPTIEDKKEEAKQARRAPSKRRPTEFTDVEPKAVAAIEYDEAPQ